MKCGDAETYTNSSGQREYVHIVAKNNCEFTAYLWIMFPNGRFIHKDIPSGETFDQHEWLPPSGKVEFECTIVSQRGGGCTFDCTVVRRL